MSNVEIYKADIVTFKLYKKGLAAAYDMYIHTYVLSETQNHCAGLELASQIPAPTSHVSEYKSL